MGVAIFKLAIAKKLFYSNNSIGQPHAAFLVITMVAMVTVNIIRIMSMYNMHIATSLSTGSITACIIHP